MDIEYDDLEPGVSPDERQRGVRRIAQIVIGVLLVAAGIVMLVIPGPGIVTILVGLNLIRPDNALVRYIRRRVPGIPEDGTVPMRFVVVGAVFLVGGTVIGVLYGADLTNWALELVGIR
ncbi:MAG: PGPGW domain-containing protein [Actinomycetota bacterium]